MTPDELDDAERKLRRFASRHGLDWMVQEVDDAISLGIPEVRELRQSSKDGVIEYVDAKRARGSRGPKRSEEFVGRRDMRADERVALLIEAMRRVLVDLDAVARASIETLNDIDIRMQAEGNAEAQDLEEGSTGDLRMPPIGDIDFAPDDGANDPLISTEGVRYDERWTRSGAVLDRIAAEVRT